MLVRGDEWQSQICGGRDGPGDFCRELVSEAQVCVGAPSEGVPVAPELCRETPSEVGQAPGAGAPSEVGLGPGAEWVHSKRVG